MNDEHEAIMFAIDMLSHRDPDKVTEALDIISDNADGLEIGHVVSILANLNAELASVQSILDMLNSFCLAAGMPFLGANLTGAIGDMPEIARLMKEYL